MEFAKRYVNIINEVNLTALKEKSIFITGGTGFFGYWLLKLISELNKNDYKIKITLLSRHPNFFLQNNPEYKNCTWLTWLQGDIVNYMYPETKFDLIIHGAANTSPILFEKPATVFDEIVSGTKHVLKHAQYCGAKRFLNISSGAAYGEIANETKFIKEDDTTAPLTNKTENAYGEAKRAAEMLAHSVAKETALEVVTARCFAFAGKGIGKHLVLNILFQQARQEQEITIKSTGKARRSFLHGRDLAVWLFKLLTDGTNGEIYNVGSDNAYTIKELGELIRDLISPTKTVNVQSVYTNEQRINYIPSIDKAKLLGLNVWTKLNESIEEMNSE